MWSRIGQQPTVPSAGQNEKVAVFGGLDAISGEMVAMPTEKKTGAIFLFFLQWILDDIFPAKEHIYLFCDNCSIHHTNAVEKFIADHADRLTVIWNARYTPELNLIERFWGHLKRIAIDNHYFQTASNLESAITQALITINSDPDHPLQMNRQIVQDLCFCT